MRDTKKVPADRAAAYARVSSEEQAKGLSIETQLDACREYAAARNLLLEYEYVEPGRSATNDRRPEFQRMVQDALTGKFNTILVYSFDRFARNMEDAVVYKSMLRRDGVDIVSILEPIDKSSTFSFVYEGMIDLFAAYYSVNLSAKIRAGLKKAVEAGRWPWPVPMGYHRKGGNIKIDAASGNWIIQGFQEFSTGQYTLDTWSDKAREAGVRTASGRTLCGSDWSRIFNNPFYKGILKYGESEVPGTHPPLVSDELWSAVQNVLTQNRNNQFGSKQRVYLLRSLLWSVDTGSKMVGAVGKGYRYYRSKLPLPSGKRHYVLAEKLEQAVIDALSDTYLAENQTAPSRLNEAVVLGLRVAPVGKIYEHIPDAERVKLLRTAVNQLQVSGNTIVGKEVKPPFFCKSGFDQKLVEMAGVEPASKKAG